MNQNSNRILNSKETAELLGVSLRTLDRITAAKGGPKKIRLSAARVGFRYNDLQTWIESREVTGPAKEADLV